MLTWGARLATQAKDVGNAFGGFGSLRKPFCSQMGLAMKLRQNLPRGQARAALPSPAMMSGTGNQFSLIRGTSSKWRRVECNFYRFINSVRPCDF